MSIERLYFRSLALDSLVYLFSFTLFLLPLTSSYLFFLLHFSLTCFSTFVHSSSSSSFFSCALQIFQDNIKNISFPSIAQEFFFHFRLLLLLFFLLLLVPQKAKLASWELQIHFLARAKTLLDYSLKSDKQKKPLSFR